MVGISCVHARKWLVFACVLCIVVADIFKVQLFVGARLEIQTIDCWTNGFEW